MSSVLETLSESWSTVKYHYNAGNINWVMTIWSIYTHSSALIGLYLVPYCHKNTLLFAFLLWPLTGFGITVGVHRLWSHRSYEASFFARFVLMILNSIANQGSILHWTRDHRVHHKHSETVADPHNANRGFFFAHIGWLLLKKDKEVSKAGKQLDFSDLYDDPVVMWQYRLDPWFAIGMCYLFPAFVASYFWGENFWYGFCVPGGLRYIFVKHCTFLVNSAAHYYGDHPYDVVSRPAENPVVSFFAIGEGWHNWHHKYPFDYAASEFGISSQFNPSKLCIDLMCACGLAWGRKRGTAAWTMGRDRRDRDEADGVPLPKMERWGWEKERDAKKELESKKAQ